MNSVKWIIQSEIITCIDFYLVISRITLKNPFFFLNNYHHFYFSFDKRKPSVKSQAYLMTTCTRQRKTI